MPKWIEVPVKDLKKGDVLKIDKNLEVATELAMRKTGTSLAVVERDATQHHYFPEYVVFSYICNTRLQHISPSLEGETMVMRLEL